MLLKSIIENCVVEQNQKIAHQLSGVKRALAPDIKLQANFITIITGIRRCGKSTLMSQLMKNIKDDFAYFNFEDPRIFGFDINDFQKLDEVLGDKKYYFFDEIQNIENWELYIRKLHDQKKIICITGSNASLLSRELGTRLTGRNIQRELFPFNYEEFCKFFKFKNSKISFDKYIVLGGFPAYLMQTDNTYLQQLFRDILYRDIIIRYGVRNAKLVEQLALYLLSNVGKEYSLNNLKKHFDIGSTNSVADYISWFEDSYLLFSLPRFSWSLKSVAINPRKIYAIDSAFIQANSQSFSLDKGRLLENMVYLQLRKSSKDIYYFKGKRECDFIVKDKNKIVETIQVCCDFNPNNYQRELEGIKEAMSFFQLKVGTIITYDQKDKFMIDNLIINVVTAYEWFRKS